jgi:type I restriction-modification system DNA methylase subunit
MEFGNEVWNQLERIQQYGYSSSTVFNDFIDLGLLALLSLTNNMQYPDVIERLKENRLTGRYEDQYLEIMGRYKENKEREMGKRPADYFASAFGLLVKETAQAKQDILGDLYMEYVSHGEHGQFFTPTNICDMMAKMIGHKDGKTVSDPCCGSGRLLISEGKINPNVHCVGVDISLICARMTAVNMWLFDLNADIYHGDSLSMKMYQVWKIRKGGYVFEAEVKSLPEPARSQIKVQAQQTLFG